MQSPEDARLSSSLLFEELRLDKKITKWEHFLGYDFIGVYYACVECMIFLGSRQRRTIMNFSKKPELEARR